MSDLVKLTKEMEGIAVDSDYLRDMSIVEFINRDDTCIMDVYTWRDAIAGDLSDMIIGGTVANDEKGSGPDRKVSHSKYALSVIATKKDVNLLELCPILFSYFSTDKLRKFQKSVLTRTHFEDKKPPVVERKGYYLSIASTHVHIHTDNSVIKFDGIITNVAKKNNTYVGDLSLRMTREIGSGSQFISINDEKLSIADVLSGKCYSGNILLGVRFRDAVFKSYDKMHDIANKDFLGYDSRDSMLIINNYTNGIKKILG